MPHNNHHRNHQYLGTRHGFSLVSPRVLPQRVTEVDLWHLRLLSLSQDSLHDAGNHLLCAGSGQVSHMALELGGLRPK